LAGVRSEASNSAQSGNIYYVTTDDEGNLGTSEQTPSAAKPIMTAAVESSSNSDQPRLTDRDLDDSILDLDNTEGFADPQTTTLTNEDEIGVNLSVNTPNSSTPIPSNSASEQSIWTLNANAISVNSQSIDINTKAIQSNKILIDQAFAKIDSNTAAIEKSLQSLKDVEEGLAAVAALPDMFLASGETFAASGGVAVFGGEYGFGATMAFRGDDRWSFGASASFGGDEVAGKLQIRWAK